MAGRHEGGRCGGHEERGPGSVFARLASRRVLTHDRRGGPLMQQLGYGLNSFFANGNSNTRKFLMKLHRLISYFKGSCICIGNGKACCFSFITTA